MSNVNILRAIGNIRSGTTVYTPLVETVVNGIQAIEENKTSGQIDIVVERHGQDDLSGGMPPVINFLIKDNGIGFTDKNRNSFDTLYSDYKFLKGGKGFGRFICLKYFEDLEIESIYHDGKEFKLREFKMGKDHEIIINEKCISSDEKSTRTTVRLVRVKNDKFIDVKLSTIARILTEKLLPYFIDEKYICPSISISESDGSNQIILNDFLSNNISTLIKEMNICNDIFKLKEVDVDHEFKVRLFKFYSPRNQHSKICLVAHQREVTDTTIHTYIPEFIEEFVDESSENPKVFDRNYIVKAYVFGDYLDNNVSLERGGFEFQKEIDLIHRISQTDIERKAVEITRDTIGDEIIVRQEKKKKYVQSYVNDEAPWYRTTLESVDLSPMPYNPSKEDIELILHKEKYRQEVEILNKVGNFIKDDNNDAPNEDVSKIVSEISERSKSNLIHYIAFRKNVLDLFNKKLGINKNDRYSSESALHDIIFPRKKDTDSIPFDDHNLWIIDERLNFTDYVSSDKPLGDGSIDRPDLLAYGRRVLFRGDNETSNPVTIFEFKKPQRDDFSNPSSSDDPINQIIRYVNKVRDGKFKTPEGRNIKVSDNTPFYGYVVCDLTKKIEIWLEREKDYKPMSDRLGWFKWHDNINLYLEVISWDKILHDATMRNKIFFHKLGIN